MHNRLRFYTGMEHNYVPPAFPALGVYFVGFELQKHE